MNEVINCLPKVTVIIVTYNSGEKLKSTVDSALSQTYSNVEVLVKDGLSNDGSTSFLSNGAYTRNVAFYSEKDYGIYDAMNRAIDIASGDYIIFINSGDRFHTYSSLEITMDFIIQDERKHDIYYGDNFTCNRNAVTYSPKKLTNYICFRGVIGHQTMLYSAKVFETLKYDLRFPISACITHYITAFRRYHMTFKYVPVVISDYEGGGISDCAAGRKRSIQDVRICLHEEYGLAYYWYAFLMVISLRRLKQWLSTLEWFEPVYRKLTILFKGKRPKRES